MPSSRHCCAHKKTPGPLKTFGVSAMPLWSAENPWEDPTSKPLIQTDILNVETANSSGEKNSHINENTKLRSKTVNRNSESTKRSSENNNRISENSNHSREEEHSNTKESYQTPRDSQAKVRQLQLFALR